MADLRALAARVEAEQPSRELADEVLLACGFTVRSGGGHPDIWVAPDRREYWGELRPNPLTSVDAALAGVPEGWWTVVTIASDSEQSYVTMGHNTLGFVNGAAATEARARTAACLRASAAVEEQDDGEVYDGRVEPWS